MTTQSTFVMSQAVRDAYARGEEDETLEPLVLTDKSGQPLGRFAEGDSVIFYNIRGEREVELTESFTRDSFDKFSIKSNLDLNFTTMIEYMKGLDVDVAFPPDDRVSDTLSEILAQHGRVQVKITEAEKAIHLGFFFNGKDSRILKGEERIFVPTRKDVALFDEAPEMSIDVITKTIIEKIHDSRYDVIIANFPNVDVVGHIENRDAVIKAVETVDRNTGLVVKEALEQDVTILVTADHGTVEKWLYPDGAVDTGHTDSPVPFILVEKCCKMNLRNNGELSDIAPTVLQLLGIPQPKTMTGVSLIEDDVPSGSATERRILLLILDGWGANENDVGNLIAAAGTPVMDDLSKKYAVSLLQAAGEAVGLPEGTVGNSEVGHLHIGAGRRIYSDRVRINMAIEDGSFFENRAFLKVIHAARNSAKALHFLGIVSFFSSHGSVNHLFALMELAKREGVKELYVHAMLGRRGERPESGAIYIEKIEKECEELQVGKVVSVIGRYWSMDREENWDRIEKTYRMLVYGEGNHITE
ncbi:MAG: alkaline phosphatase family protein [Deltaproteobacteria bacterium]|nr:alkaline phosphatase family protein [Deltaproteobacteria bacterium]